MEEIRRIAGELCEVLVRMEGGGQEFEETGDPNPSPIKEGAEEDCDDDF